MHPNSSVVGESLIRIPSSRSHIPAFASILDPVPVSILLHLGLTSLAATRRRHPPSWIAALISFNLYPVFHVLHPASELSYLPSRIRVSILRVSSLHPIPGFASIQDPGPIFQSFALDPGACIYHHVSCVLDPGVYFHHPGALDPGVRVYHHISVPMASVSRRSGPPQGIAAR
jgi:hypothetical protein